MSNTEDHTILTTEIRLHICGGTILDMLDPKTWRPVPICLKCCAAVVSAIRKHESD